MFKNLKALLFFFFYVSTINIFFAFGVQGQTVNISGSVKNEAGRSPLPFVNIIVKQEIDTSFVTGTISNEEGIFNLSALNPGKYFVIFSVIGFHTKTLPLEVGRLSPYLDMGNVLLSEMVQELEDIIVEGQREDISEALDRKTYTIDENISQLGGSVLQAMQNLPGITIDQEGKIYIRGSDKVAILLDGKQTAITGIGAQSGLENFPASSVDRIEIINNPSSKYDATGNAGIINIIFKKEKDEGWNGKVGMIAGLGNPFLKKQSMEGLRSQYQYNPKLNPSFSVNYRKNKVNFFFNGDLLWHKQMMKNEFTDRFFNDGTTIRQQFIENRTQPIYNLRTGLDYNIDERNSLTFSTLFNYREYTDLGDILYTGDANRLWQYYENEVNQTLFVTLTHVHKFKKPGQSLTSSLNYSFRRKDEVFNFTNLDEGIFGTDTTALIADEHIIDANIDFVKPLRSGRIELGTKQRSRVFPNFITFNPGFNSILDPNLAGSAEYREWLSAFYGNYVLERKNWELEAGLRLEYVDVDYLVDPNHAVYESAGFDYFEPFPSLRASYYISDKSNLTFFYNRRVDRPEEKDLRAFPTYADPEILSMGNPTLIPQFTQSVEAGYKLTMDKSYFYSAIFHRSSRNILTRIITEFPGTNRLVSVDQNGGNGWNTGLELVWSGKINDFISVNINSTLYQNRIAAFSIINAYPGMVRFDRTEEKNFTGNVKLNGLLKFGKYTELQLTAIYLAPDIVPQGRILARYHVDAGLTRKIQNGNGELFVNASDLFNTLVISYQLEGNDFALNSDDFFETQVFRLGYNYRF
ncbi:MAG: TonB-dependent receptor [Cyclobacteriaceae bacterium]|nr:TonB-dependent receptor [Cyclobacteriaceae bacterium]